MAIQMSLHKFDEIDLSCQNVPYFESKANQFNYFYDKKVMEVTTNMHIEPSRTSATIDQPYHTLLNLGVNYVSAQDQSGKLIYYFIVDFEYKTSNATTLILKVDVMQTYMFDIDLRESFVDRMHVDRYKRKNGTLIPAGGTLDEGLQTGEYHFYWRKRKTFVDRYLIASTSLLGKNEWSKGNPDQPPIVTGDCWKNGKLSSKGFRFIKGFEAFGQYAYKDHIGKWTIGYGVTKHAEPDVYNKLKAKEPLFEKEAAISSYELKANRYGKPILNACKELGITKQCQFDALLSFSYNLGIGVINNRDSSIYKAIKKNINDREGITRAFGLYINAGDPPKPAQGLIDRRRDEANIFFGEYPKPRPILTINQKGQYGSALPDDGWLPSDC